jgi:cell division protein FtsW (lipid II flippase)
MKIVHSLSKKFLSLVALCLLSVMAFAQDKDLNVDIDVDKGGEDWYMQPWVWVVAGAVFILLLVAMLRGGKKE